MTLSIRLTAETDRRLTALVSTAGHSKACYLRQLIENGGMDDIEDYVLGMQIKDRVHSGKEAVLTSKEVRKNLDLDN